MPKAKPTNEFDMEESKETPEISGNPDLSEFDPEKDGVTDSPSALSSDYLNELGFDDEADKEVKQRMTIPQGDWVKAEEWQFFEFVVEGDCQEGDINPRGRTKWKFQGYPEERTDRYGNTFRPMLSFQISRDKRFKQDKPGEDDTATKLYVRAKDMYFALYERSPKKVIEMINMLKDADYSVSTMNFSNGPFVNDIKKTRERR